MKQDAINQEFENKVRRGIFNSVLRYLTNPLTAEEFLQDAICKTWDCYRRNITEKGRVLPDALLVYHCRLNAIDLSSHFVPSKRMRYQDVYNPRAYRDDRVSVIHPDNFEKIHAKQTTASISSNPESYLNEALDFESWVDDLDRTDRYIVRGRLEGYTWREIGTILGHDTSVIWRKAQKLGLKLARKLCFSYCPAN